MTSREEALRSGRAGAAAREVVMATEPAAAEPTTVEPTTVEPAVPSLVDRYFTRWYKAGKCGKRAVSAWPHRPGTAGTAATDRKSRALTGASSQRRKERDLGIPL